MATRRSTAASLLPAALATPALLLLFQPAASAQMAFTDVSAQAGVAHRGESYGASWGDLNGDGFPDLFASNHRQRPSLFLNVGNGTFLDTGPQVLPWRNRSGADTHGGSWADIDNDGDQDLLVSTGQGNPSQLLMNEFGRLIDRAAERGLTDLTIGGRLPIWLDYDTDGLLDYVLAQYAGIARLYKQQPNGTFLEATSEAQLVCRRSHYGHLLDVSGDGRLDFLCADEPLFPQKIYDTASLPWTKLFDNTAPSAVFPIVPRVADSILGDFNNDGRMDMFLLGGVQLRPTTVDRSSASAFEANLTGGTKGVRFVSPGVVTVVLDWSKRSEKSETDLSKIRIGASGRSPTSLPLVLDPADPGVHGTPPAATTAATLPQMHIGYNPNLQQWTMVIQTKLTPTSPNIFSEAYLQVSSTARISQLTGTGRWPSDKAAPPTLLVNDPTQGFVDRTAAAGLGAPVQCGSVTTGDFDNDMDLDLYLACRTGAANIPNVLYENLGNGTFQAVANAGGAAGQVGTAVAEGAGTADTAVTADYDVDGFLDVFVTNGFSLRPLQYGGESKLFRNASGNGNHWIQLDLIGRGSIREAVGARVYAIANGVTQMRVQNGAYHRWAQDMKRSHFGLGSATSVDLRVEWPSGAVETFAGVPVDRLYRLTEGAGLAEVTLGLAVVYSCGPPPLNGAVDSGIFLWRDCPSGEWRLKTVAAGGQVNYAATITSTAPFARVKGLGLDSLDTLDWTSNPLQIAFDFTTQGKGADGVNFIPADGTTGCLRVTAPAGVPVYYGPLRVRLTPPFSLESQAAC
jgi:hypothetical protein